jgi:hypothetical protein
MRKVMAGRGRAVIVAMTVTAAAWGGLMVAVAAPAAARDGGPQGLGGWAPWGHGRTMPGPWGDGWRSGPPLAPPTLSGDWAPFNRCPVDNPTMLAADGEKNVVLCADVSSPSGAIKLGGLALPTTEVNTQFGLVSENHEETETTYKLVSPLGGAPSTAPIEIPNGLSALVCPGAPRELWWICGGHHGGFGGEGWRSGITAVLRPAGELSNFDLDGALTTGVSLVTMPVKIQLENELLGPQCYIGSDSEPIVLQLGNLTPVTSLAFEGFESNGTPVTEGGAIVRIGLLGATGGDESFAAPGVSGCGFKGELDGVIDHNAGLPAPAGDNSVQLNEASTYLAGLSSPGAVAPNDGKDLSQFWHSSVEGGPHGYGHH